MIADRNSDQDLPAPMLKAAVACRIVNMSKSSFYELAARDPELVGAVKLGRTLRFRRHAIERLARGEG